MQALIAKLPGHLEGAIHIAERPQCVGACDRDHVNRLARRCQFMGQSCHRRIHVGVLVDKPGHGAEQMIQKRIAVGLVKIIGPHPFQNTLTAHAATGRGGGGLADMIGLRTAGGDDRRRALRFGFGNQEFKFADLVAAECETGAVVALDPDIGSAERFREVCQKFQRCRQMGQPDAREPIQQFSHQGATTGISIGPSARLWTN